MQTVSVIITKNVNLYLCLWVPWGSICMCVCGEDTRGRGLSEISVFMKEPHWDEDKWVDLSSLSQETGKNRQEQAEGHCLSIVSQKLSLPMAYCKCGKTTGREKWGKEWRGRYESDLIPSQDQAERAVAFASVRQEDSKSSHTETIWCQPRLGQQSTYITHETIPSTVLSTIQL